MSNPILSSDLYKDDGAIRSAIEQLVSLESQYKKMVDTVRDRATEIKTSLSGLKPTNTSGRSGIEGSAKEVDALAREYKKYQALLKDTNNEIAKLKVSQANLTKAKKLDAQVTTAKAGSLQALNAQLAQNQLRLSQMTEVERLATKEGYQLSEQTVRLKATLLEYKNAQSQQIKEAIKQRSQTKETSSEYKKASQSIKEITASQKSGVSSDKEKAGSLNALNALLKENKSRLAEMTEAEKLSTKEGYKLTEQTIRLEERVKSLSAAQRQAVTVRKLEKQAAESQAGSYNQLSAQYSLLKIKLNQLTAEERENTAAGRQMEKQSAEIYDEMKRLQAVTGKTSLNVGNYTASIVSALSKQKSLTIQLRDTEAEFKRLSANVRNSAQAQQYHQQVTSALKEKISALSQVTGRNIELNEKSRVSQDNLWSSAKRLLSVYLGFSAIQRVGSSIFKNTKELDALNLAYEQTIPNTEELSQTNEFLNKTSEDFGISILSLRKAYLRYNAAIGTTNLTTEETQKVFKSVSKATSVLGLSAAKTDRTFNALEQIISKGKVSSEELRQQLGDSLPGSLQIMAAALGVSTSELDKMLKKGEVLSEDAIPKFAAELERAYGIEQVERIDTLTAAQGRFSTSFVRLVERLDGAGVFTEVFKVLESGVKFLTANVSGIYNLIKAIALVSVAYGTWRASMLLTNAAQKAGIALTLSEITAKKLLTVTVLSTRKAFDALKIAIASNPIGAIATVIIGAATAFALFKDRVEASDKALRDLDANTQRRLTGERIQLDRLLSVARDETKSKEERKKAIEAINAISPAYLSGITQETINTDAAKGSIDRYINSLRAKIRAQEAAQALEDLENKRSADVEAGLDRQVTLVQKAKNLFIAGGSAARAAVLDVATATDNATKSLLEYEATKAKLFGISTEDISDIPGATPKPTAGKGKGDKDKDVDPFKKRELLLSVQKDGLEKELAALELQRDKKIAIFRKEGLDETLLTQYFVDKKAEIIEKYDNRKRDLDIASQSDGFEKELTLLEIQLEEQIKVFETNGLETEILTTNFREKRLQLIDKYNAIELQKADAAEKARIDLLPEGVEKLQAQLDFEYEVKLRSTTDKLALDRYYQVKKEEIEKQDREKVIAEELKTFDQKQQLDATEFALLKTTEKRKTEFKLEQERDRLEALLLLKRKFATSDEENREISILINQIRGIDQQIDDLAKKNENRSLFDILGFNLDEGEQQALGAAFSFAMQQITDLANTNKQIAAQNVEQANTRVAEAQRVLNAEISARNANQAHNVDTARREFQEAKNNQRKALQEQQRAQEAEIKLQAVAQSGNLILAASKIFAQFGNPFVSVPLVALMFGAFAAAKIKALQATKKEYAQGGLEIIGGGSHASGDDTPLGFSVNGKQAHAERGEAHMIIKKQAVPKTPGRVLEHVFKTLNAGTFVEQYINRSEVAKEIPLFEFQQSQTDTSGMEGSLSKLVDQGRSKYYKDGQGHLVHEYGNLKRVYV